MKRLMVIAAFFTVVAARVGTQSGMVTYVDAAKVAAAVAGGGPLVTASNLSVSGNHRAVPGQVEVHDKETDILYVVEGQATIVTGGTMMGGRQTGPGQSRGTDMQGGEARPLKKGDVIVIPAGVPHWFKDVSPSINYLTMKVIAP
jgi:quercetin dioxygenase-like cupin family protein